MFIIMPFGVLTHGAYLTLCNHETWSGNKERTLALNQTASVGWSIAHSMQFECNMGGPIAASPSQSLGIENACGVPVPCVFHRAPSAGIYYSFPIHPANKEWLASVS